LEGVVLAEKGEWHALGVACLLFWGTGQLCNHEHFTPGIS